MSRLLHHRRVIAAITALTGVLALAATAQAHAVVSPPVAKAKTLQYFTLSVPTEKSNATTTRVEMTVPSGFSIDSFEPPPAGWTQHLAQTGSGDSAVVTKVTWSGGHVPTGQDAVFHFNASTSGSKTYVFDVRQTYSDGSVVDWNQPETSDTPAPRVEAVSSLGGNSSSTLAIVALVVGAIGLIVGVVALVSGKRSIA